MIDANFEERLLNLIDQALSLRPTKETFTAVDQAFRRSHSEGIDRATSGVKHLLDEWDVFDELPAEYAAALDNLLLKDRRYCFIDVQDELERTVPDELTEQDRKDGYQSR